MDIITSYIGADSSLIFKSIEAGADGIVIESLGAGHVPPTMIEGIREAVRRKIPVVLTSRVPVGRLMTNTYGYDGGEKQLKSIGVIFGEDLSAYKARIKLIVLISLGMDYDNMRHEFEKNFYE